MITSDGIGAAEMLHSTEFAGPLVVLGIRDE